MREASVGFQCPECVKDGNKSVRQARTVFGGRAVNQGTPWVTITLILLNLAAYAGELQDKAFQSNFWLTGSRLQGPDGREYVYQHVMSPGLHAVGVTNGEWYRLITSNFIHSMPSDNGFGVLHIVLNMVALWQIGPVLEHALGRLRFGGLYLLCGLGSSIAVYLLAPDSGAQGASGAVFGLVGAYFVLSQKRTVAFSGGPQLLVYYVIWMVISFRITSWQGHLGGLVTGLALGAVLAYAPRARQAVVQAVGYAAVALLLVVAFSVQYSHQKAELPTPITYEQSLGQSN